MAKIIDGKAIAAKIRIEIAAGVQELQQKGITPGLAVVLVGDDPASRVYVSMKEKACHEAGIFSAEHKLPAETSEADTSARPPALAHVCPGPSNRCRRDVSHPSRRRPHHLSRSCNASTPDSRPRSSRNARWNCARKARV